MIYSAPEANTRGQTVLVTGGTGFVAVHCILQLLQAGYRVRTTVRTLERKKEVLLMLDHGGISEPGEALTFFAAALLSDDGWAVAVTGCDFVLHVASPFPATAPRHEDDLILPAREGALRVLRAARDARVKRVVMTSSFAAIGYGHAQTTATFTEKNWTDVSNTEISAYVKSKTLAEESAWDFVANEKNSPELAVINPVGIFGPLLGPAFPSSVRILKQLLDGDIKACPHIYFNTVDVRDVANLHIRAMTSAQAQGERFLALAGNCLSMHDFSMILKNNLGELAHRVPTRVLPNWLVRSIALISPQAKLVVSELGKVKNASNQKARILLGWDPRTNEEALLATARSLVEFGLLAHSKN